jgi:predicted nucleotidyltransferase
LEAALARHKQSPDDGIVRDACIQRFEFTYELSHEMLRRFLEATSANPADVGIVVTQRLGLNPEQDRTVRTLLTAQLPAGFTARLFGSRAKGDPKPYSDLDLALKGRERLSLVELAELAEALSESDLPFKVDVVELRTAGPTLQGRSIAIAWT